MKANIQHQPLTSIFMCVCVESLEIETRLSRQGPLPTEPSHHLLYHIHSAVLLYLKERYAIKMH